MLDVGVLADDATPADLLLEVRDLLVEAFDGRFDADDWEHSRGGWRVMVFDGAALVSHVAVVPRLLCVGDRPFNAGYVEGVATRADRRGQGRGARAMAAATQLVRSTYELGALSTSRQGFYARSGWESWRGPTFVRDGGELLRTPDDDDGVMVLRCGPSAAIDLAAPICCAARPGDDW
jgi:aminoglycoside 2'-N-acetyltransferase I